MTPPLSYAEFLAVFVVVPVVVLGAVGPRIHSARRRPAVVGVCVIVFLALSYTIPWDNYLISQGVWEYAEGTVLLRIGHMPVEEYTFVVLQSVLTALWLYRRPLPDPSPGATAAGTEPVGATDTDAGTGPRPDGGRVGARYTLPGLRAFPGPRSRAVGTLVWGAVAVVGAVFLFVTPETFYLGAILAWAAPGLALQWAVGGGYLWRVRRRLALAITVPTLYLCLIDRVAVEWGLWQFSTTKLTGWTVLGLPVEEAVFFLLTNALVVHGLLLFHPFVEGWRGFGLAGRSETDDAHGTDSNKSGKEWAPDGGNRGGGGDGGRLDDRGKEENPEASASERSERT